MSARLGVRQFAANVEDVREHGVKRKRRDQSVGGIEQNLQLVRAESRPHRVTLTGRGRDTIWHSLP